jgi:uncharacterized protein YcbK (DUF882 family)
MNMDKWKVTIDEFECKCGCGQNGVDINFLRKLNQARDLADTPFIISSGYRCSKHNEEIGGVPTSAHTKGLAADILCSGSRQRYFILKALLAVGFHRIGIGEDFIHVDDDTTKDKQVVWTYY